MKALAALGLASLALLTSGCIAAVIPLAAGAAVVKSHSDGAPARPEAPTATASARSDLRVVPTSLTEMPPPDPPASLADRAVLAFQGHALAQAEIRPGAGQRTSAIVPAASELRPVRTDCGNLPAAVFIDLDPGRETFDPLAPGQADPALGSALGALRERGIRVVWFSRLGANFADAARAALAQGGLDPAGADPLVLMHDIGERKQTLRDEIAQTVCPVAMLGDERADFDELYLYLKDPDSAIALDAMIGQGWFLASPFRAVVTTDSGATP